MVIGGCLGAAVGTFLNGIWPTLVPQPEIYAIVGMAGFFSASGRAPISTIIMVSELTGDYELLLPTMWVSTLCFVLGRPWTLYEKQVWSRLESPAHRGDFQIDLLEGIRVADVSLHTVDTVPESMPLQAILQQLPTSRQHYFPVIDGHGKLVGIFSMDDVRAYLYDESLWALAVAGDIMTATVVTVRPDDDLNTAMRRFTEVNIDELPVVSDEDSTRLLGMLRRRDAIAVYNQRLVSQRQKTMEHA
jgi:CIC family chloride channel protein